MVTSGNREVGEGSIGVEEREVQTIKMSYRVELYNTGNITSIL